MGLRIESIGKMFVSKHKQTRALNQIDLDISTGEFICLVGPSGCGKSTLLNIIAGLEKASSGRVFLDDQLVNGAGTDRAVLFQDAALFPWLRVIDNVEFGMKMVGIGRTLRRQRALKYLRMVHLTEFQDSYVHELSGGMKQRVALARALTLDARVMLMDEPFAALDSQTKQIMRMELQRIWGETQKTVLFVTHDVEEAVLLADRVFVMTANPGGIKSEHIVAQTRPRQSNNLDLMETMSRIKNELREEVEKVAAVEYDSDWRIQENQFLPAPHCFMGINLSGRG